MFIREQDAARRNAPGKLKLFTVHGRGMCPIFLFFILQSLFHLHCVIHHYNKCGWGLFCFDLLNGTLNVKTVFCCTFTR